MRVQLTPSSTAPAAPPTQPLPRAVTAPLLSPVATARRRLHPQPLPPASVVAPAAAERSPFPGDALASPTASGASPLPAPAAAEPAAAAAKRTQPGRHRRLFDRAMSPLTHGARLAYIFKTAGRVLIEGSVVLGDLPAGEKGGILCDCCKTVRAPLLPGNTSEVR